jgi:hypothetical protein
MYVRFGRPISPAIQDLLGVQLGNLAKISPGPAGSGVP